MKTIDIKEERKASCISAWMLWTGWFLIAICLLAKSLLLGHPLWEFWRATASMGVVVGLLLVLSGAWIGQQVIKRLIEFYDK